jgi:uncharacterized membrane protein
MEWLKTKGEFRGDIRAYIYLCVMYACIYSFWGYYVWVADKPLGYFFCIFITLGIFVFFIWSNHLFVRHWMGHKAMLLLEFLLLLSLFMINECSMCVVNRTIEAYGDSEYVKVNAYGKMMRHLINFLSNLFSS